MVVTLENLFEALKSNAQKLLVFLKECDPRGPILVVVFLCAFLTLFNLVPHGQSPDETAHMYRASSLAHGDIVIRVERGIVGSEIDDGLIQYYSALNAMPFHYERKANALASIRSIRFTGHRTRVGFHNIAVYFPLVYAPQALAIFIGEQLHLRVYVAVCLARLFCFLSVCGLVLLASRMWKFSILSSFLFLMPISLFQIISSTGDGVNFAMTLFIVSLFLNLRNNFTQTKFLILLCFIFVLATHRFNLIFLFALPFFIALNNKNRKQLLLASGFTVAAIGWILIASAGLPPLRQVGMRSQVSTAGMIAYYCLHPHEVVLALWRTATNLGLMKFYMNSFVGQLGWLDYLVNKGLIYFTHCVIWALLLGCVYKFRKALFNKTSLLLFAVAFCSLLATFGLLLVGWTDFPCTGEIIGVQGRYLIPVFIILGFAMECYGEERSSNALEIKGSILFFLFYGFLSLYFTQTATLWRYWLT